MNPTHSKSLIARTALAGAFAFVGHAEAANLITNGSFETGTAGINNPGDVTGWSGTRRLYNHPYNGLSGTQLNTVAGIDSYGYGVNNNVLLPIGTKFHGLTTGPTVIADTQIITTTTLNSAVTNVGIDGGGAQYAFSSWLASYNSDNNTPALQIQFFAADNGTGALLGSVTLDRGVTTNQVTTAQFLATGSNININNGENASTDADYWALYKATGTLPSGTRSAVVSFVAGTGHVDASQNDWYADAVVFDVVAVPEPSVALLGGLGVLGLLRRRRA